VPNLAKEDFHEFAKGVDPELSTSRGAALTGDGQSPAAGFSLTSRVWTYPQVQVEEEERAVVRREAECEVCD
jgi:hypothetical protein